MIEIVSDLVGKTVECINWDSNYGSQVRGTVRGVYVDKNGLTLLVEAIEGLSADYTRPGELVAYPLTNGRVRVVEKCARCWGWKHPSQLSSEKRCIDTRMVEREEMPGTTLEVCR